MKRSIFSAMISRSSLLIAGAVFSTGLFTQCDTDNCSETHVYMEPVYGSLQEVRDQVIEAEMPREIENPGKIYTYQNIILVGESGEGIHIIDNSDPSSPTSIGFLPVPGNMDMAVKGGYLYADSYMDLVVFDVRNWNSPEFVKRSEGIYSSNEYPMPNGLMGWYDEYSDQIILRYEEHEYTYENACEPGESWWLWSFDGRDFMVADAQSIAPVSGQGGSLARFTVAGDYLYAVDWYAIHSVNISNGADPVMEGVFDIGWGIETIFPSDDKLFMGTQTGMIITSIATPGQPEWLSQIDHVEACDPVVVQGDYAYVTIRGGNDCGQVEDQLFVVDISNPSSPYEIASYQMESPYGLGIDGDNLFICEGSEGLKMFDAGDVHSIGSNMVQHYSDVNAYDVIPRNGRLFMIGEDGLYQYEYTADGDIQELSHLPISGLN